MLVCTDGIKHHLAEQWAYINGAAEEAKVKIREKYHAIRDKGHQGMGPDDFLNAANALIIERRKAGRGTLPEKHAMLTRSEVLAVRLYTGPCAVGVARTMWPFGFRASDRLEVAPLHGAAGPSS